jgi:hypothetical protein
MKKLLAILVVIAIAVGAVVPVLVQADTASACGPVGLSPGYWKNHTAVWDGTDPEWDGPLPGAYFDVVFGVGPHQTLLEVLNTGGGKLVALNRAAVAALLNSYWLDSEESSEYYYSEYYIIYRVVRPVYGFPEWDSLFSSGDWQSAKSHLESTYD